MKAASPFVRRYAPSSARQCRWMIRLAAASKQWISVTALLLTLPEHAFAPGERLAVTVGKPPYVRFDVNEHFVTHAFWWRPLVVSGERTARCNAGKRL